MYDKITLELRDKSVTNIDSIADRLDSKCFFDNYNQGYKGKLKNFDVTLVEGCIKLTGSLTKYFWGNNIRNLSRMETCMAIFQLSNTLKLPIEKAKVTYIEFSFNFEMKYPPQAYFYHLGYHKSLGRFEQPDSVYYRTKYSNQQYFFYDKVKEAKSDSKLLNVEEKNLLRYEIRLNRLTEYFQISKITCEQLYEKDFYQKVLDSYIEAYLEINKNPIVNLDYTQLGATKSVIEYFAMSYIEIVGQNKIYKGIEEMRLRNALNRNEYYSKAKAKVRTLCDSYKDVSRTPIIDELTSKVLALKNSAYAY